MQQQQHACILKWLRLETISSQKTSCLTASFLVTGGFIKLFHKIPWFFHDDAGFSMHGTFLGDFPGFPWFPELMGTLCVMMPALFNWSAAFLRINLWILALIFNIWEQEENHSKFSTIYPTHPCFLNSNKVCITDKPLTITDSFFSPDSILSNNWDTVSSLKVNKIIYNWSSSQI